MSEHPKMLYRPHESGHAEDVWGHKCNLRVVHSPEEEAEALGSGWHLRPPLPGEEWPKAEEPAPVDPAAGGGASEFSLLDQSAKAIAGAIPELTTEELSVLLAAEKGGKARKGVVKLLQEAVAARQAPPEPTEQ